MQVTGILPAAGYATRLAGRVSGSKELLPVAGRPVIEHSAAVMQTAGVAEVRVVTRPAKDDLIAYATSRGWRLVLGEPPTAAASVLLGVDGLPPDAAVLVAFPDTVFDAADPFTLLLQQLTGSVDTVLGLFHSPVPSAGDVVDVEWAAESNAAESDSAGTPVGIVHRVEPKPAHPTTDLIWSLLAARRCALDGLEHVSEVGHLLDELAQAGSVRGVLLPGRLLDIGTPEGLAQARKPASRVAHN